MTIRIVCLTAALALAAPALTFALPATAQEKTTTVGGAPMYPSKTIVENAVNSADHTTLVAAVKAAGLVETLQGKGPFTVFAPTNAARSEEHTSELQSRQYLVCRLLLEKKKNIIQYDLITVRTRYHGRY